MTELGTEFGRGVSFVYVEHAYNHTALDDKDAVWGYNHVSTTHPLLNRPLHGTKRLSMLESPNLFQKRQINVNINSQTNKNPI